MFKTIVESSFLRLLVGFILLYTSGAEVWHEYLEADDVAIGAHHGILVFAVVHILKTLPDIMEGLDNINESRG
ncbi:MAG: hypothetical protein ACFHVJ_08540 [Aestuariibacter sp.]